MALDSGRLDFVRSPRSAVVRLISGRGHYETVIAAVRGARTSIWIATANLKELMVEDDRWSSKKRRDAYRSVIGVFAELVGRGVEIRLLHAAPPSRPFRKELGRHAELLGTFRKKTPSPLAKGSFAMRDCPRVHMKAVIVDGSFMYLGSANWTGAGLGAKGTGRRNFEAGIVTDDTVMLDDVQELFDRIWRGAECKECKLRAVCPGPLDRRVRE
jgi:phosphatidylserine/phosphatidylglycerophosphate/cardiolipin synthase-like enzyme